MYEQSMRTPLVTSQTVSATESMQRAVQHHHLHNRVPLLPLPTGGAAHALAPPSRAGLGDPSRACLPAPPGSRSAAKPHALPCPAASRSGGTSQILPVARHGDVTRRLTPPRFKSEIEFVCSSMSCASNLLQFPVFFHKLGWARTGCLIRF